MKIFIIFVIGLILLLNSCNSFKQGERIYLSKCSNCHGVNGEGLAQMYPALDKSIYVNSLVNHLPCIILNGKYTLDKNGNKTSEMPPVANMGDVELTNLINYLQYKFNPSQTPAQLDTIVAWRLKCK